MLNRPLNARIKTEPEDFIVEELPAYEPCGEGTHAYFWLEKQKLTTPAAANLLIRALGLPAKAVGGVGYAGLKDAAAVTRQWFSLEHVDLARMEPARLAAAVNETSGGKLRLLAASKHRNKLKRGHARGNRFILFLRPPLTDSSATSNASAWSAAILPKVREELGHLQRRGVPNFFGEQRFGRFGDNAALGKLLAAGKTAEFQTAWAKQNASVRADAKIRNLLVNAFQADLFNRVLRARLDEYDDLWLGDLAWLHRNGAVFAVTAEELDDSRRRCLQFEISASGPMFGPKMTKPTGKAGDVEGRILAEASVTAEDFGRPEAERQPGARRPLRIPFLEEPMAAAEPTGLRLHFALPAGAYATTVLKYLGIETQ
jgi:tRNA pseudouridine13 synthase